MKSLSLSKRIVNIAMKSLDEDAILQLAISMTKGGEWPRHIIKMIMKSTEGVPKNTVKIIEAFINMKHVEVDDSVSPPKLTFADSKLIAKTIESFEKGATSAVLSKFDTLDVVAQSMLKIAAVFGGHFTCDMIIDLLPYAQRGNPAQVKSFFIQLCAQEWMRLDNIADRQIIVDAENIGQSYADLLKRSSASMKTFSFNEDRTMKLIYNMIPETPTRKQMHVEAAMCLRRFYEDDLQAIFPLLAHHYKMGSNKEEEVKMCQMASLMSARQGHLAEAARFLTQCLALSNTVKFTKFENFDKGSTLAGWCLLLAQCEYAFGRVKETKDALLKSLDWLHISKKEPYTLDQSAGEKELNKLFTNLGFHLFKTSPAKKISVKADKLNCVSLKVLSLLFMLAMMELDEPSYIMYGTNLIQVRRCESS